MQGRHEPLFTREIRSVESAIASMMGSTFAQSPHE